MVSFSAPPSPQSWTPQGDCADAITVRVMDDGTFGFEAASGMCEGPPQSLGGSCTVSFDFATLPTDSTFVVESATVEVIGTPGVTASVTLAAFWPGDDDLIGLTAPVTIGEDGTARLAYRRSVERASYACPNFPQIFVHTELGVDDADSAPPRVRIAAVRDIQLAARPCTPAAW